MAPPDPREFRIRDISVTFGHPSEEPTMSFSLAPIRRHGRTGQLLSLGAAALVVAFGSVLPAAEAQASVVYSGALSVPIPVSISGVYLNVVTGATSSSPAAVPGWDINPWGTSTLFTYANNSASPNDGIVQSLGSSATLSDNLALATNVNNALGYGRVSAIETSGSTAFLLNSNDNYIGFRFLNEGTGTMNFGWMRIGIGTAFNSTNRFILGYAYENTGASINVGNTGAPSGVPEPASLALAAMALMGGLAAGRRRRAA